MADHSNYLTQDFAWHSSRTREAELCLLDIYETDYFTPLSVAFTRALDENHIKNLDLEMLAPLMNRSISNMAKTHDLDRLKSIDIIELAQLCARDYLRDEVMAGLELVVKNRLISEINRLSPDEHEQLRRANANLLQCLDAIQKSYGDSIDLSKSIADYAAGVAMNLSKDFNVSVNFDATHQIFQNYGDRDFFENGALARQINNDQVEILLCAPISDSDMLYSPQYRAAFLTVDISDTWLDKDAVMQYIGMDVKNYDPIAFAIGCTDYYTWENWSHDIIQGNAQDVASNLLQPLLNENNVDIDTFEATVRPALQILFEEEQIER